MRHAVLDRWSQGSSPLHLRDPRAKLAVLLAFLIAIASTSAPLAFAAYAAILIAGIATAGLPVGGVLARAGLVLPFAGAFAFAVWLSGDGPRAVLLLGRAYLSGIAAVVFAATTPLPAWVAGLHSWRVPRALVLTIQFLYRYLFVLAEQAQRMRWAARMRGGSSFVVGVLFARSWERAHATQRAMLARGFQGRFPQAALRPFRIADALFTTAGVALAIGIRVAS